MGKKGQLLLLVIDETESDLRARISLDFGPLTMRPFSDDLIDWLHYKARCIPSFRRAVVVSSEVSALTLKYPAIAAIRNIFENGGDVTPWLSDSTRTNKLVPGADMMFNDWQIIHLHLGNFFVSPSKIRRSGPLLFCHITATEATMLDVAPHGAWTKTDLLEILLKTNPKALERYEFSAITPQRLTDTEYGNLRTNGVNSVIEIAGRAFKPGMGHITPRRALRIVTYAVWFLRTVGQLKNMFETDQVPGHLKSAIYAYLSVPVRLGALYSAGGLTVVDKNRYNLVLNQMQPIE